MYDEPTAGLDPVASTVVEDLIRGMHTPTSARSRGGITSYMVGPGGGSGILVDDLVVGWRV